MWSRSIPRRAGGRSALQVPGPGPGLQREEGGPAQKMPALTGSTAAQWPLGAWDPSAPGLAVSAASVQEVCSALWQGWHPGPKEEVGGSQALLPGCAGDTGLGTAASPELGVALPGLQASVVTV